MLAVMMIQFIEAIREGSVLNAIALTPAYWSIFCTQPASPVPGFETFEFVALGAWI